MVHMVKERILVVDDEKDILEVIRFNLEKEGYTVKTAESGEDALRVTQKFKPDLIVLDLMLPGIDGLQITRLLKTDPQFKSIPIIMLTAKSEETDVVVGLELGADDYITKPFSPRVLIARIKAVLRRKKDDEEVSETKPIVVGEIVIHPGRHEVTIDGKPIDLTHTEFKILSLLARRPGWVFTRYQIVDEVHGENYAVTDRSVDVQIAGLRKKLGPYGKYIETVRGVGYRLGRP